MREDELNRVSEARLLCYARAARELPQFEEWIRADGRGAVGDFLLAEQDGLPVGTATSYSMHMWVRGGRVACQGVGWVGTARTHRRGSGAAGGGVASQVMRETLRRGREREQVVSALMPFRASFYEHFGYGVVERRCTWTLPLGTLPSGDFHGMRFFRHDDLEALAACRQRDVELGQCDIERSAGGWELFLKEAQDGHLVVDVDAGGAVRGYAAFQHLHENGKDTLKVTQSVHENPDALRRQLYFLASLRDQYSFAAITVRADLPLNWLLKEVQLPHRPVNHPAPAVDAFTRMQLRVLDHGRFIGAMRPPGEMTGKVVIAVHESEGTVSRFVADFADGRGAATASQASAQFECADRVWAAVACGDLKASQAVRLGLATAADPRASLLLDGLADGPLPFCQEYF